LAAFLLDHSSARLSEAAPALAADVLMENVVLRLSPAVMHGIAGVSWLARGKRASNFTHEMALVGIAESPENIAKTPHARLDVSGVK
jgi:hypothetical protein